MDGFAVVLLICWLLLVAQAAAEWRDSMIDDDMKRGGNTGQRQAGFLSSADAASALGYDYEPVTYPAGICEGCGKRFAVTAPHVTRCIVCDRIYRQAFDEDDDIPF